MLRKGRKKNEILRGGGPIGIVTGEKGWQTKRRRGGGGISWGGKPFPFILKGERR